MPINSEIKTSGARPLIDPNERTKSSVSRAVQLETNTPNIEPITGRKHSNVSMPNTTAITPYTNSDLK